MITRPPKTFPLPPSVLQGPLENDLVVHVALIAESQRYEIHVGRVFLVGRGDDCFILPILSVAVEINFTGPLTWF